MRIDSRETEILERRRAQRGQHERRRRRRVEVAAAHTIEQVLKFGSRSWMTRLRRLAEPAV